MKLKQEDIKKYGKEEEIDFLLERNFDGTGPSGKGPRTGRGLGKCSKKRKKRVREDIERYIGKERSLMGTIVSIGPGSWTISGTLVPTTLKEGQKVIVPPMGPTKSEYEGQEYYICSEKLVLAIVD